MKRTRVLVVDDHQIVREGIVALLRAEPSVVVCGEAGDGESAVAKALTLRPDLVILDLGLPDVGGLEVARRIREQVPGARILIFTLHDSGPLVADIVASGAQGYVLKSDASRDLLDAVRALRDGRCFFSSKISEALVSERKGVETGGAPSAPTDPLTKRERQVLTLLAEGRTNKQVALLLGISPKTVDAHRTNLMRKLGLHSIHQLVRHAIREGLIQP